MKFHDEKEAYEWAVATVMVNMAPRCPKYEFSTDKGRTPQEYWLLDAISILHEAKKHDIVDWRGSWFLAWFMPNPVIVRDWHWAEEELSRLHGAAKNFLKGLESKGFISL